MRYAGAHLQGRAARHDGRRGPDRLATDGASPEALCGAWPIILHPKTLSGATAGDSSAYRSKNSRLHIDNQRSQGVEGRPELH